MNAPSEDIKDILVDESSLALVFSENIFTNLQPEKPRNVVTIYDTPGFPPYLGVDGSKGYEYPSIQIVVRDAKPSDAWSMIENIKDLLHGMAQTTVNGTLYSAIICSSGPALLDWDDNGNIRLFINFNLQRRSA